MPVLSGTDKTLTLPPGFRAIPAPRPWEAALAAAEHLAPGNLLHAPFGGLIEAALLLAPECPVTDETVRRLATLALRDAILSALPPHGQVDIAADGGVTVNQGEVATVRTARGPALADGTPSWLLLGISVRVALGLEAPGLTPWQTDLAEEGAEISAADLLAAICRHLLAGIDAWREALHPA